MTTSLDLGIDPEGLIKFMRSLFGDRKVFLRELIQNSLEAINIAKEQDPQLVGEVRVEVNRSERHIAVHDNGWGMNEHELRHDLTRVFRSGWPEHDSRTLGIGQFGFGFFSVMLVASRVVVRTRPRALMNAAPDSEQGEASGLLATTRITGQALSVGLAGAVFAGLGGATAGSALIAQRTATSGAGLTDIAHLQMTFLHGFGAALLVCASFAAAGVFTALVRREG